MEQVRAPTYETVEVHDNQFMYIFSGTDVLPPEEFQCNLRFDTNTPYTGEQLSLINNLS